MKYLSRIVAYTIAIGPIIGIYKFFIIPIDLILYFIISIFLIFKSYKFDIKLFIILLFFLIVGIFSVASNIYATESYLYNNSIIALIYFFLFCYLIKNADKKYFSIAINNLTIMSSIIIIIQSIGYLFFNNPIHFHLPFSLIELEDVYKPSIEFGRPNSVFLEPSHFTIYTLPVLYICLKENKYYRALLIFIAIILSTSTTGFSISLLIIIYYFLFRKKKILLSIISTLVVYIFSIFLNNVFLRNFEKLDSDNMLSNVRIFGTTEIVDYVINNNLYFGIGLNQISSVFYNASNYANSYFMIFISYGVVGIVVLLVLFNYLYTLNKDKLYLFIMLLIMFSDQIIFNRNFFYLISIIYLIKPIKLYDEK